MGATVTKVESPDGSDYLRFSPPLGPDGDGAWFSALNAGKESVALNLKRPSHLDAVKALIAGSDVVIEGFRPGVMKRLGLDPATLLNEHPALIVCSISGYGQTGPMCAAPGHDLTYQAVAGALSTGARRDGVPQVPGILLADLAGGALTACMRVCAALVARARTGKGRWVDVSMAESALALMAPAVSAMAVVGENPVPGGDLLTGAAAQYRIYRCKDDQFIAFAPLESKFWSAFLAVVGGEVEADSMDLALLFSQRDRDEWVELLANACCAPVLELDELLEFPQHQARQSITRRDGIVRVSHPENGGSETAHLPSPRLGEHTAHALRRVGYDPAQLEER